MLNEISKNKREAILWDEAWIALAKIYPFIEEKDTRFYSLYKKLFYSIFDNTEELSCLSLIFDEIKNENGFYYDIYALDLDKRIPYSLKASQPNAWTALDVDIDKVPDICIGEIVAYCLYEMSWFGFMNNQDFDLCTELNQLCYRNDDRTYMPGSDVASYLDNFRSVLIESGFKILR